MGTFSQMGGSSKEIQYGFDATNVRGQAITAGAANTKGSFTDIVSAAGNTRGGNYLKVSVITESVSAASEFLLDIAIGPATETIIVNNLYLSRTAISSVQSIVYEYEIPICIPSGIRISARIQSTTASALAYVYIKLLDKNFKGQSGLSTVTTYGANTANSSGVLVAHGTAGWGGSWVAITTSTTKAMRGFFIVRNRTPLSWSTGRFATRMSIGSSGNEDDAIIYEANTARTHTNEVIDGAITPFIPIPIAENSRLSIKVNSSVDNTDFDFDFIIYGVS